MPGQSVPGHRTDSPDPSSDPSRIRPSAKHPIIVIGASAGGVEALVDLVAKLPSDLTAAMFIAVHFPASSTSLLPQILSRLHTLPAHHAVDGEPIQTSQIYIAPPNHHLLISLGRIRLSRGPRENGHRPAIDTMFRSAAYAYRDRVIGVILTGTLDDGTAGLLTIKALGGMTIVQDPEEALFDGMPRSAIETVNVDWVLRIADITRHLVETVAQEQSSLDANAAQPLNEFPPEGHRNETAMPDPENVILDEDNQVARSKASSERGEQPGNASPLTCPDCGGVLWELRDQSMVRFRCHVGHAYSIDSLVEEQSQDVEKSLWTAVRALEEKAALARRMAVHAKEQHRTKSAQQFEERASETEQHAAVIRQLIINQISRQASVGNGERGQPQDDREAH
ncbi:chemotaxis protein CheB [Leptolyngbya ohadii]|uniref:chemotaxis protein CheB n=1 Tax=Leptolyngbya ohadii TaxID=1962290 RepID=UPI000B5A0045|nr:chemotaxis protein CheB [Leptolyngbya ohadii]